MEINKLQIDPFIFEDINQHFEPCTNTYDNCIVIKRLLTTLSYYTHLDIDNNTNHQFIFNNFMDIVYKYKMYDDFYHFTKYHQNEIESIMDLAIKLYQLSECDITICIYSDRHFKINNSEQYNKDNNNDDMKYFDIYKEMMDSLHFYLFHLITSGLRLSFKKDSYEDDNKIKEKETETDTSLYFDESFSRISNVIEHCREKTKRFTRLSGDKFNASAVYDVNFNLSRTNVVLDFKMQYLNMYATHALKHMIPNWKKLSNNLYLI